MVNSLQLTSIILQITCIRSQIQQTAFITANEWIVSYDYHFHVTSSLGATANGSKWNIDVVTQYGSDLSISLNPSWGFHPTFPSSISFIINGSTPYETLQQDANILFVFGVSGKYFTATTPLNASRTPFTIYPQHGQSLVSTNINNMMSAPSPPRNTRYAQNNSWHIAPITSSNMSFQDAITWPMCITIMNDPGENIVTYQWRDAIHPHVITATYNTSFRTNAALSMYLAGDIANEQFTIYSFNISNHFMIETTLNPTTTQPTATTTAIPTTSTIITTQSMPTLIPSALPTTSPIVSTTTTESPTSKRPTTEAPTTPPTAVPTVSTIISLNTTDTVTTSFDTTTTEPLLTSTINTVDIDTTAIEPALTSTINEETTLLSTMQSTPFTTYETLATSTEYKIYATESATDNNNNEGEVREETTAEPLSLTVDNNEDGGSRSLTINFDSVVPYVLVIAILLFGLTCFIVGLCVGVTLYKRDNVAKNNDDDKRLKRDSVESELAEQIANGDEKQLSSESGVVVIHIAKDTDDGKSMYDDNSLAVTQPYLEQEVESLPDPPIHIHEHRKTISDDGESHILSILCAPPEHSHNIHVRDENDEIVVDPPYVHKVRRNKVAPVSDDVSVSYADHDDEKDNRLIKTRTPGQKGMVKQYGIVQPDVFPDDEGTEIMRPKSIKSEIEIEMQRKLEKRREKQKIEEEKYFKLMKKIMLDEEGSGVSDMNDEDVIGPLPELQNINQLSVKSMFIYQHNKKLPDRKSLSHSNKTGRSFETVIDDEKQIELSDDEADDEGLEDLTHDDTIHIEQEKEVFRE